MISVTTLMFDEKGSYFDASAVVEGGAPVGQGCRFVDVGGFYDQEAAEFLLYFHEGAVGDEACGPEYFS